ncbi:OsmC family protein [Mailhella sp.]|uniref:OsmC family protein n=1 Tax=Mailhella sp. TaxID=1981029 RepID=UPI003AB7C426
MSDVVEFEHTPDGFTVRTGHPLLGDIHADYTKVSPDRRLGTARVLLVSAALDCFCGTLNAALLARDVHYRRIVGTGRAEKTERDGVSWVTRVSIDVRVDVDEADVETLEHCLKIVKGCMITRSLMEGIQVDIHAERA